MRRSTSQGEVPGIIERDEEEFGPRLLAGWQQAWQSRRAGGTEASLWPAEAAGKVADALAGSFDPDEAGRLWARAHSAAPEMVGRLSALRAWLLGEASAEAAAAQRVLDQVTTAAAKETMSRLERISRTDPLTGVGNRRALDEALHAALAAAAREGYTVSVAAIDLDGLKRINDTEGHAAGDEALVGLAAAVKAEVRDQDLLYRVGGDEFVLLLPFTSPKDAGRLLERIASNAPSFSWGTAAYPGDAANGPDLLEKADEDLYRRRQAARSGTTPASLLARLRVMAIIKDAALDRPRWLAAAALAIVLGLVGTAVVLGQGTARRGGTRIAVPGPAASGHASTRVYRPAGGTHQSPGTPTSPSSSPTATGQSNTGGSTGGIGSIPAFAVAPAPGSGTSTLPRYSRTPTSPPTTSTTSPPTTTSATSPPSTTSSPSPSPANGTSPPPTTTTTEPGGLLGGLLKATGPLSVTGPTQSAPSGQSRSADANVDRQTSIAALDAATASMATIEAWLVMLAS